MAWFNQVIKVMDNGDYTMMRKLFKSDLAQLLAIEQAVHVAPWTEETFKMCFQAGYLGWVVELEGNIIGFVIFSMRVEECHILNVCVLREFQRQGFGRLLMEQALSYAKEHGAGMVYLEVRRTNTKAISLYQNMGFQQIGERKNYYPAAEGGEDAIIFAKGL